MLLTRIRRRVVYYGSVSFHSYQLLTTTNESPDSLISTSDTFSQYFDTKRGMANFAKKITVADGWKPGAVSKCLLRKLNQAKRCTSTVERRTPSRRTKKTFVDKPSIIVSKKQGVYSVEIQAAPDQENYDQYKSMIYKVAPASNEEKIKRRERRQRRLTRNLAKEWSDPYHPELCEETCLRAYKEAVCGLEHVSENGSEAELESCSCEDDASSGCSSLDVDWEIHYTPPIVRYNAEHKKPLPECTP